MIERITKKLYLFFQNHIRGLYWCLYIAPVVGVISCNDFIFRTILYICVVVCFIIQVGNMKKWNERVK